MITFYVETVEKLNDFYVKANDIRSSEGFIIFWENGEEDVVPKYFINYDWVIGIKPFVEEDETDQESK